MSYVTVYHLWCLLLLPRKVLYGREEVEDDRYVPTKVPKSKQASSIQAEKDLIEGKEREARGL